MPLRTSRVRITGWSMSLCSGLLRGGPRLSPAGPLVPASPIARSCDIPLFVKETAFMCPLWPPEMMEMAFAR